MSVLQGFLFTVISILLERHCRCLKVSVKPGRFKPTQRRCPMLLIADVKPVLRTFSISDYVTGCFFLILLPGGSGVFAEQASATRDNESHWYVHGGGSWGLGFVPAIGYQKAVWVTTWSFSKRPVCSFLSATSSSRPLVVSSHLQPPKTACELKEANSVGQST